jgi:phosphatidylglycerophosphate synthase
MIDQAIVLPPSDGGRRVAGLLLLDRTLLALARAGVRRAIVVGGGAGERDPGLAIERAPTLAAAAAAAGGPVILSPADRVFEPALAKLAAGVDLDGVDACVAGGLIAATPAFLAHANLDDALAAGRVRTLDAGDLFWADVTDDAARARAERELFRRLRKPVDGPVARHVNRRISLRVTRLLLDRPVTPNQMSIFAGIIGLAGVALIFAARSYAGVVAGAALVQVQSILDGCDGEIARLKFLASKAGEWIDNATDDALNVVYCAALGAAAARLTGQPLWGWIGAAGGLSYAVFMAVMYYQLATVHHSGSPFVMRWWFQSADADLHATFSRPGASTRVAAALRALGRRDVMLLGFLALVALRLYGVAVLWYAAIGLSNFVVAVAHLALGGIAAARRLEEAKRLAPAARDVSDSARRAS